MDDLCDMGHFPLPIYVGATGNLLMTILRSLFSYRHDRASLTGMLLLAFVYTFSSV
jgi:hypothetical protein